MVLFFFTRIQVSVASLLAMGFVQVCLAVLGQGAMCVSEAVYVPGGMYAVEL